MSADQRRILVVEDDTGIRTLLGATVRMAGYDVRAAADAGQARAALTEFRPDLLVLDVMLPGTDGFAFTRQLRADGITTPVLFLTAHARIEDRVTGLRAGGDDYLVKPFNVEELLLRIRAIVDRVRPVVAEGLLRCADLTVDVTAHEVRRAGRYIPLGPTEFRLLCLLMRHPDQVLGRAEIIDEVWGDGFDGDPRVLETYVRYLRRKVDTADPRLIHTIRSVGYCLRQPRSFPA